MILTVITINLNNKKGLEQTIESVVYQSFNNFEYIIIDGGSTDGSLKVIQSYSNYINYWVSEKDSGIYNAMNKGIEKANGEYLLFLNSGDYLHNKDVLEKAFDLIKNSVKDIYYFDLIYEMDYGRFRREKFPKKLNFHKLFFGYLPHPASFIKKNLFNKIGYYDENLKITSDWKFFILAIIKFNCSYKYFSIPLTVYNKNGLSSDSKNLLIIKSENDEFLKEFYPDKQILIQFLTIFYKILSFSIDNKIIKIFKYCRKYIFLKFRF